MIVRIDPRYPLLIVPDRSVLLLDRPRRIHLRRRRILEHDDPRDREHVVGVERVEERTNVAHLAVSSALVLSKLRVRGVKVQPELVLHIDDETVDLRRIGDADEPAHATRALRRESVDVQAANHRRRCRIAKPSDRARHWRDRHRAVRHRDRFRARGMCLTSDRQGRSHRCRLRGGARRARPLFGMLGCRRARAEQQRGQDERSLTKLMHITTDEISRWKIP